MQEQTIFSEALEKEDPAERAAFLDRACANDVALRQRIERLLERHQQGDSLLEPPVAPLAATIDAPAGSERPGTVIGPYKLLQQIGEGGMGAVFMAEQTHPVQRKVALKIIKPGMDSQQVIARFEAERQALALMDHPNIAKVLDAGTTETGRPYFVMELVKGVLITRYCDEHHLTCKQRLELFVPVCQAVQHAHQKGIIHRDIKPSNVLIALYDDKPVPKVIDFGIAKATGQKLTDRTLFTEFGQVVGTLEYMSPEQAGLNQLDIDTRSDLYSLGVLLYELLTGTTPLERKRLRAGAMLEMLRLIREEEPPKPSTRLSTSEGLPTIAANRGLEPKKLSGLVRGELDWIVMKALEKDRNRRYETANGFAMDVQRYLTDEPVLACPPSSAYRLRKFLRRNKGPVLATTLVLFMLVVGLITGTAGIIWHQNEEAKRATADAVRQADEDRKQAQHDTAEALRQAATERKQALAEQAIGAAVDQAEKSRAELQQNLRKPGGVFGLLNEPKRWQAQIQVIKGAVDRARALQSNADAAVKSDLNTRIQLLEILLVQDEADWQLAVRLEKIRMDRAVWVDGKFDDATAVREYPRAFAEAKLPALEGDPHAIANRIGSSAIKEQLVAALDDWALVNFLAGNKDSWVRLLDVARLANPDPLGDRLRQPKVWNDRKALTTLSEKPPPANLSPQLRELVGALLRRNTRKHPAALARDNKRLDR